MARDAKPNPDRSSHVTGARTSPGAWVLLLALTAVGLAGDLWTKSLAFERVAPVPVEVTRADVIETGPESLGRLIPPHEPVTVIPSVLDFTLVLNPGAVFGIGAGQRWFFVAFTVLAMGVCLWMFGWWTSPRDRLAHASFALVIAGGLGNLYDRLMFACVRDFIHPLPGVKLPFGLNWPSGEDELWPYVSNVADAYLIVGIAALVWFSFKAPAHHAESSESSERPAED